MSEREEDGERVWAALNTAGRMRLQGIAMRHEVGSPWYANEAIHESLAAPGLELVLRTVFLGETVAVLTDRGRAALEAGERR